MSTEMASQLVTQRKAQEFANGRTKFSRDVDWYQADLTQVSESAIQVFQEYSRIPKENVLNHIYLVREMAWEILPYPCIGLFRFLDLGASVASVYPEVLKRVRAGDTFLDLGCCFGQDIRKLVHDGAPAENILGVDSEGKFIHLGYKLFNDKEELQARFYTEDVFDDAFLEKWRGKVDIVYLGSFLHLFSFDSQKLILAQLVKLLRKRKGSLVFGRHLAAEKAGLKRNNSIMGWDLYHHSRETICQLWAEAPEGEWDVSSQMIRYGSESWNNGKKWQGGEEIKQMTFVVRRV